MPLPFLVPLLVQLAISVSLTFLSLLIVARPKSQSTEFTELESPKATAGDPRPVVFGTVTMKGLNVLWYGEKTTSTYDV